MVYDHDGIPCYLREYTRGRFPQAKLWGKSLKRVILALKGVIMATVTATSSGMCSACFNRYPVGTKLFLDRTGKAKHASCGHANMVASAVERKTLKRFLVTR